MANEVLQRLSRFWLLLTEASTGVTAVSRAFPQSHNIQSSLVLSKGCIINLNIFEVVWFNQELNQKAPRDSTSTNGQADTLLTPVKWVASDSNTTELN